MTLYKVTIEDRIYEVKVEEIETKATTKAEESKTIVSTTEAQSTAVDGTKVPSPLAGTIMSVKVKVGDQVSEGDILLTLEALKLENEIVSPATGTVVQIISAGEVVTAEQVIAIIS